MNEFKEQMNRAFRALVLMEDEWNKLGSHERETVEQVAQETGFDELGNFEEVVNKFKQLYLQMKKVTIIDGYQVYIDDYKNLNIVEGNKNWVIKDLKHLRNFNQQWSDEVTTETIMEIVKWYIEEV